MTVVQMSDNSYEVSQGLNVYWAVKTDEAIEILQVKPEARTILVNRDPRYTLKDALSWLAI